MKTVLWALGASMANRQEPDCPKCGGGNAMLSRYNYDLAGGAYYECRDCGYSVLAKDAEVVLYRPKCLAPAIPSSDDDEPYDMSERQADEFRREEAECKRSRKRRY